MCRCNRDTKHRPYGTTKKKREWCPYCDRNLVLVESSKGAERNKAKREIEKERKRIGK